MPSLPIFALDWDTFLCPENACIIGTVSPHEAFRDPPSGGEEDAPAQ